MTPEFRERSIQFGISMLSWYVLSILAYAHLIPYWVQYVPWAFALLAMLSMLLMWAEEMQEDLEFMLEMIAAQAGRKKNES